jgi:NAD(P)-dependent dehydrogenase (short-subunit alcohol dehydrogenase family)
MSEAPRQSGSGNGPVAIVTGASRGIGRATAIRLGQAGWRVVLVARSQSDLKETARSVAGSLVLPADVSQLGSAERIVRETMDRFGRIDALVNNAGVAPLLPVEQTTDAIWTDVIDTNLSAAFYLSRACWPVFKRQGSGGVIVNVSSVAARDPFPGFAAYGAAKAALNSLTLSLAREGSAHSIRVHAVAPGATETDMFRALPGMSDYPRDKTLAPDDVARVIVNCITGELRATSGEVIYLPTGA